MTFTKMRNVDKQSRLSRFHHARYYFLVTPTYALFQGEGGQYFFKSVPNASEHQAFSGIT